MPTAISALSPITAATVNPAADSVPIVNAATTRRVSPAALVEGAGGLLADGSVATTGDLDLGGNSLVNAANVVTDSDFSSAYSILAQQAGTGSPAVATVGTNEIVGRLSGDVGGLTAAQVRGLLNVEDGADVTDSTNVEAAGALMTAVAGQIAALTAKASPTASDFLLIEDAAASNAKRRITIGDLPSGGGGGPTVLTADTASAPVTTTLPALSGLSAGDRRIVLDTGGNAGINAVTIEPDDPITESIEGQSEIHLLTDGASVTLIYDGTMWRVESFSTGHAPFAGVTGLDGSNYYQGGAGDLGGATGGFYVEAYVIPTRVDSDPSIVGNMHPVTPDGWRIVQGSNFFGFEFYDTDDTGGSPTSVNSAIAALSPKAYGRRPVHIFVTVSDNGSTNTATLWIDAQNVGDVTSTAHIAPGAGNPRTGHTTFATGLDTGVLLGWSYEETGTLPTGAEIEARVREVHRFGHLVAGALDPAHRYDGNTIPDVPATWADVGSAGTAVDLTRTGTPSTYRGSVP